MAGFAAKKGKNVYLKLADNLKKFLDEIPDFLKNEPQDEEFDEEKFCESLREQLNSLLSESDADYEEIADVMSIHLLTFLSKKILIKLQKFKSAF